MPKSKSPKVFCFNCQWIGEEIAGLEVTPVSVCWNTTVNRKVVLSKDTYMYPKGTTLKVDLKPDYINRKNNCKGFTPRDTK